MQNPAHFLRLLSEGQKLDSGTLHDLRQEGLIEAVDVTNQDTPEGQRDLLFSFITEKGKRLSAKAIIIIAAATLSTQGVMTEYMNRAEPKHTQIEINIPETELSFAAPSVSGAFSEFTTTAHFACPQCGGMLAASFSDEGILNEEEVRNRVRIHEVWCDAACDWHGTVSGPYELRLSYGRWGEPFSWSRV